MLSACQGSVSGARERGVGRTHREDHRRPRPLERPVLAELRGEFVGVELDPERLADVDAPLVVVLLREGVDEDRVAAHPALEALERLPEDGFEHGQRPLAGGFHLVVAGLADVEHHLGYAHVIVGIAGIVGIVGIVGAF